MNDIAKRLKASVSMDAINGDSFERGVCAKQMSEAARVIVELQAENAKLRIEADSAYKEAHSLAVIMHRNYFHEVTQWEPLDYTAGLLSQIDNMAAGLGEDNAKLRKVADAAALLFGNCECNSYWDNLENALLQAGYEI